MAHCDAAPPFERMFAGSFVPEVSYT